MKNLLTLFILSIFIACSSSNSKEKGDVNNKGTTMKYENSMEGVKKLAADLDKTEDLSILKELQPTLDDCKKIMIKEDDAQTLFNYSEEKYKEVLSTGKNPLRAKEGQTEIFVRSSLVGGNMSYISGGYSNIESKIQEDTRISEIVYAFPGEETGMKYSAFVFINGKYIFIPKFYYAFN